MTVKDDGGTAFPSGNEIKLGGLMSSGHSGMTLRDYFAAKAMQSMVAAEFAGTHAEKYWAESAYKMADAMLKERAK